MQQLVSTAMLPPPQMVMPVPAELTDDDRAWVAEQLAPIGVQVAPWPLVPIPDWIQWDTGWR